jgi:hypothetical protein
MRRLIGKIRDEVFVAGNGRGRRCWRPIRSMSCSWTSRCRDGWDGGHRRDPAGEAI